jgi:hypothetical protein
VRRATDRQLHVERFVFDAGGLVCSPEAQCVEWMIRYRLSGPVVFQGRHSGTSEREHRARIIDVVIRNVDVRRLVEGRR